MRRFLAFDVITNNKIDEVYNYFSTIPGIRISRFKHVTLSFFGNIDIDFDYLHSFFSNRRAFTVEYKGIGGFPSYERAKVIWIGVNMEYDIMEGFKYQKNDVYHLTVGRTEGIDLRKLNLDRFMNTLQKHKVDKIKLYETIIPGKVYKELAYFFMLNIE